MRKHLLAFVCAVSALVLVCVVTGQAQDLKVAFVDLQKFASKSVKAQTMQKKLMDLMNTKRTALENKKKELAGAAGETAKAGAHAERGHPEPDDKGNRHKGNGVQAGGKGGPELPTERGTGNDGGLSA